MNLKIKLKTNSFPFSIKDLKNILKDIALSSSMHGLSNIFRAKSVFYKMMWSFFGIIGIISFLYFMWDNLSNYYKYDVVTNIKTYTTDSLEFPPITLCISNFNFNSSDFFDIKRSFDTSNSI